MTTEEDVSKGAGTAIGIATAACAEFGPGAALCSLGAAIASALTAFGVWISGLERDTYHPDKATSEVLLTLARVHPAILLTMNIDKSDNPDLASRQARYLRKTSGEVPLLAGEGLNNPNYGKTCDDPRFQYQCADDPREPLTSMAFMQKIQDGYNAWVAAGGGTFQPHPNPENLKRLPQLVPSPHQDKHDARLILSMIRHHHDKFKWALEQPNWHFQTIPDQLQEQMRAMRRRAGESGPDPGRVLEGIFGGDLTVSPEDHRMAGAGTAQEKRGHGFMWLGLAAAVGIGTGAYYGWPSIKKHFRAGR